ncbi:PQQ-dependent sugar dehydrogenase [Shewanella algae]|uniref:PQQ-dependent sugar dehydrogenase n=1 Tax=Shewanella algae TaxID=38313 RepID=UPI0031F5BB6E
MSKHSSVSLRPLHCAISLAAALSTAALLTATVSGSALAENSAPSVLKDIRLPQGFEIEVYLDNVANARQMALGSQGTLFIGSRGEGKVYAAIDTDADGRHDKVKVIASGLNMPSGLAFRDQTLYVGAVSQILAFDNIEQQLSQSASPSYRIFYDDLPTDKHHGWKYLKFAANGRLYIPIGAPCNICDAGSDYSKIISLDLQSKQPRLEAAGVRNSVGFDFDPVSGQLWFTDNGRDMMGDDMPADELNHLSQRGQHFGYPYVHQGDTLDPEFGKGKQPADFSPPEVKLGAHVAALGMTFYRGDSFPKAYHGGIFIAEHGSWNRSSKVGYRVRFVPIKQGKAGEPQVFAEGWLKGETVSGRPADVLQLPDGSLLVADDAKGRLYRIFYSG